MRLLGGAHLFFGASILMPSYAHAQQIAGGGAPDISVVRVAAAFLICIAAAIGLIAVVRTRKSSGPLPSMRSLFQKIDRRRHVSIVEVLTLPSRMEVALIRHDETEYLMVSGQFGIKVLSRRHRMTDAGTAA